MYRPTPAPHSAATRATSGDLPPFCYRPPQGTSRALRDDPQEPVHQMVAGVIAGEVLLVSYNFKSRKPGASSTPRSCTCTPGPNSGRRSKPRYRPGSTATASPPPNSSATSASSVPAKLSMFISPRSEACLGFSRKSHRIAGSCLLCEKSRSGHPAPHQLNRFYGVRGEAVPREKHDRILDGGRSAGAGGVLY